MTYFDNCCVQNDIYLACKNGYNGTNCQSKNVPFLLMDLTVRENATVLTKYVTISTDVCNQLDIHLLTKVIFL